jgi:hypothetical protein
MPSSRGGGIAPLLAAILDCRRSLMMRMTESFSRISRSRRSLADSRGKGEPGGDGINSGGETNDATDAVAAMADALPVHGPRPREPREPEDEMSDRGEIGVRSEEDPRAEEDVAAGKGDETCNARLEAPGGDLPAFDSGRMGGEDTGERESSFVVCLRPSVRGLRCGEVFGECTGEECALFSSSFEVRRRSALLPASSLVVRSVS